MGVQRELLKMLESAVVAVPTQFGHASYQAKPLLSTADIVFVACGAFSGLKSLSYKRSAAASALREPSHRPRRNSRGV